ncbi:MAG TPA: cyclic nucleotide-binding domain-containing protein [Candidatus Sulfopaludibacter sp.]|jgi:CRP-like cAMP-binding protein|nr:cyclic nucleotide-binding domain-containing protein [Candidatus Sulfopaludibacter sp.]
MTLDDVAVIRRLDFFESLDDKLVKRIAQQCFDREFASGDFIIRQGEPGLGVYFITTGKVKVEIENQGSRVTVAELGAGDCVGELAIVDDRARSAHVVCLENTKCLLLTRDGFSKLMNKHPQLAIQMVKALVARLRATNAKVSQAQAPAATLEPAHAMETPATNGIISMLPDTGEITRVYATTKSSIQKMLVGVFAPLYVARAMTRFSMAVIGCPVTVQAEPGVWATTVDDVKVCIFPSCEDRTLRLQAFGDGEVSVTVLRPAESGAARLSRRIRRDEHWRLHIPRGSSIWMEVPSGEAVDAADSR